MRMSDLIEEFIKDLFDENEYIEIQRNDLAEQFNCVPSQINYVISTRFKPSQGYYVESRRGGGGHIKIQKMDVSKTNYMTHIIKNIGDQLTNQEVEILISDLLSYNLVTEKEAKLLKVATSDNILITAKEVKDTLRAKLLKNMLLNII
ncbi:MAG: CtsR family transcriptional regulator [Clostridia bacterium]|nr:CtsR family transcriptional regulator [Clostridia bacterium]